MMKAHLKIAIILFARVAKFIDRLLFLKNILKRDFLDGNFKLKISASKLCDNSAKLN